MALTTSNVMEGGACGFVVDGVQVPAVLVFPKMVIELDPRFRDAHLNHGTNCLRLQRRWCGGLDAEGLVIAAIHPGLVWTVGPRILVGIDEAVLIARGYLVERSYVADDHLEIVIVLSVFQRKVRKTSLQVTPLCKFQNKRAKILRRTRNVSRARLRRCRRRNRCRLLCG